MSYFFCIFVVLISNTYIMVSFLGYFNINGKQAQLYSAGTKRKRYYLLPMGKPYADYPMYEVTSTFVLYYLWKS